MSWTNYIPFRKVLPRAEENVVPATESSAPPATDTPSELIDWRQKISDETALKEQQKKEGYTITGDVYALLKKQDEALAQKFAEKCRTVIQNIIDFKKSGKDSLDFSLTLQWSNDDLAIFFKMAKFDVGALKYPPPAATLKPDALATNPYLDASEAITSHLKKAFHKKGSELTAHIEDPHFLEYLLSLDLNTSQKQKTS